MIVVLSFPTPPRMFATMHEVAMRFAAMAPERCLLDSAAEVLHHSARATTFMVLDAPGTARRSHPEPTLRHSGTTRAVHSAFHPSASSSSGAARRAGRVRKTPGHTSRRTKEP